MSGQNATSNSNSRAAGAGRAYNAPRQSTATQIRLKVTQSSVERLMQEVDELADVKNLLLKMRDQLDSEGQVITKLCDVAVMSMPQPNAVRVEREPIQGTSGSDKMANNLLEWKLEIDSMIGDKIMDLDTAAMVTPFSSSSSSKME